MKIQLSSVSRVSIWSTGAPFKSSSTCFINTVFVVASKFSSEYAGGGNEPDRLEVEGLGSFWFSPGLFEKLFLSLVKIEESWVWVLDVVGLLFLRLPLFFSNDLQIK